MKIPWVGGTWGWSAQRRNRLKNLKSMLEKVYQYHAKDQLIPGLKIDGEEGKKA